jgi:YVTN family beta-propeller protein
MRTDFLAPSHRLLICTSTIALLSAACSLSAGAETVPTPDEVALRRPTALALSSDGNRLVVANRDRGSLSVIDVASRKVVGEQIIGQRLSDVAALPHGRGFLATDEGAHELVLLRFKSAESGESSKEVPFEVLQRLKVSPYPVSVVVDPAQQRVAVASLWSRQLTLVELPDEAGQPLRATLVLDLPFAPRKTLWLSGEERLLVADGFAGTLGVVDPAAGKLLFERKFPGHNIRGLALSEDGDKVLLAHQMLNDLANSIQNDIHWGLLMSNDLRYLRISAVLDEKSELYAGGHMFPLGVAGRGAADPAEVMVAAGGQAVVALAGTDEVAIGSENEYTLERAKVGRHPVAVELSLDGKTVFVANQFDDSISMVDLRERQTVATIQLGPMPELSLAQRGELLFHDGRLSHDNWMSCQSCHTDGHTNGQMNDNLSDRSFGSSKRVLSLLGSRDTAPYAWNGSIPNLATQVRNSIEKTMQRDDVTLDDQIDALVAYTQSLSVPPPVQQLRGQSDATAIARGREVFVKRECANCHAGETYTSTETYDVGLLDKLGNRKFNPPSLRGLNQRGPFMHDNRATSLEAVFSEHGHPDASRYTVDEVRDLVEFLRSL